MTEPKKEAEGELTIVPNKANASVEIVPFGTTDRIRLSAAIVRQMIATPTRTGKLPDDNQCIKFIMLCQARHLNPFEGDAFMLGYDTQSGPQFSLITAHQVFLKRAEASKGFNGMESGVIVKGPQGGILEREGDLVMDDEKLIGGWAKVYRKDREKPFYRRLKLATFNTGRSRWEKDPAGMICKCAEADALRTAFPTHLGGLYIEEEPQPIDVGAPLIKRANVPKLKDKDLPVPVPAEPTPAQQGEIAGSREAEGEAREGITPVTAPGQADSRGGQDSKKKPSAKLQRKTKNFPSDERNQLAMRTLLREGGYTTDDFMKVALANEWVTPEEIWPLPEGRIETFLTEDNRQLVLSELAALKK